MVGRIILLVLAFITLAVLPLISEAFTLKYPPRIEEHHPEVVRIGQICSGFVVKPGVVATAGHCFWNWVAPTIDVTLASGEVSTMKIVYHSSIAANFIAEEDFAILVGETGNRKGCILQPSNPGASTGVHSIGFPGDAKSMLLSRGMYLSVENTKLKFAGNIYPGDSGSALFNQSGEVVGIVVEALFSDGIPIGWAVDIDPVIAKLEELEL